MRRSFEALETPTFESMGPGPLIEGVFVSCVGIGANPEGAWGVVENRRIQLLAAVGADPSDIESTDSGVQGSFSELSRFSAGAGRVPPARRRRSAPR